jgi:FAD/FMN-containing dehydrogenase
MEILKPGAAGYEEGRRVFNGMIDRRPALIALCETEDDVRAALDRAARDGLPVSVRGGGHNVAGHGIGEGSLVIHLGRMRHTEVDAGLGIAHRGAVMDAGAVAISASGAELLEDPRMAQLYLGGRARKTPSPSG